MPGEKPPSLKRFDDSYYNEHPYTCIKIHKYLLREIQQMFPSNWITNNRV
jgi:hypothetical protein